jgi:uncharacterized glyoxalase superfamily protein PhnB
MAIKNGVPEGHHTVTAHLVVKGAKDAIAFYKKAFGAEEIYHFEMPGGGVAHAEIRVGDSIVWLADEQPQMGAFAQSAPAATTLHLFVKDADAVFAKAVEVGAKAVMPLTDMFWGARYGQVVDPFGHKWSIATQKREVSPQEMAAAMKKMAG